jgi:hypothetical protein
MRNFFNTAITFITAITGLQPARRVRELEAELINTRKASNLAVFQAGQNQKEMLSHIVTAQNLVSRIATYLNAVVRAEGIENEHQYVMFITRDGRRLVTCVVSDELNCIVITVPRHAQAPEQIKVQYGSDVELIAPGVIAQVASHV